MTKINTKRAKQHLSQDSKLSNIIKKLDPLDLPPSGEVFNELVKAIAYQQISYKAADTIYGRFLELIESENFAPEEVLSLKHTELRAVGFSTRKAEYVKNIADFFLEEKLIGVDWSKFSDLEIIKLLSQIKGVGEWTVEMMLIFQLKRPDIFPLKDLGIQQAVKGIYGLELEGKALISEMNDLATKWVPYRTLASLYLWSWKRANP